MRLLLCEDEIELSNALAMVLKYNKYSVDTVYNGEEALNYINSENYDAIILDIMMPKIDGLTVLKKIREKGNNVPIIMVTAKSQTDDKVTGLDLGANDYLTKPFETKELLARIRSITRQNNETQTSILSMGNISLNRANFELKSDTGSFRLANKEFQMLEFFMMNENTILSAERLFEKIWGFDSDSEISVIWVYISYLRKKLLSLNANIQIKASRNVGYLLEKIYGETTYGE